jgi:hypothetical protein
LFILSTGAALRLYKWTSYGFWFDETQWLLRFFLPRRDFLDLLTNSIWLAKPPFFRLLLYFWRFIGSDEFTLRMLPFIFGVLSILFIYKIGKILFEEKTALIAAFLIAISPFHIYYSQELTHYTLTLFLILGSAYYFLLYLQRWKIVTWLIFIFITELALYTNYICVFFVIFENIFFFLCLKQYKKLWKGWVIAQLALLLLYAPWIFVLPQQFYILTLFPNFYDWIPQGSFAHTLQTFRIFNSGYNSGFIVNLLAALVFFSFLLSGIIYNFRTNIQRTKFLLMWLCVPIILSISLSAISRTFTYRNLIIILPAYYFLVASGIAARNKKVICAALICITVLSCFPLVNYYRNIYPYPEEFYRPGVHPKKESRQAARYIIKNFKNNDVVICTCADVASVYIYYLLSSSQQKQETARIKGIFYNLIKDFPKKNNSTFVPWYSPFVINGPAELPLFINDDTKRVWFVISDWEPRVLMPEDYKNWDKINDLINSRFTLREYREFTGVEIYLYEVNKL